MAAAYSMLLGLHPHTALVNKYRALDWYWTLLDHPQLHDAGYQMAVLPPHRPRRRPLLLDQLELR